MNKRAIIVLGARNERFRKRFDGGLSLYLQSKQNSIMLISGRDFLEDKKNQTYLSLMCKQFGISDVVLETTSPTTKENAIYSRLKLDEIGGIKEVNVVTNSSHTARTKRYFKKNFEDAYKLKFYAAPEGLKVIKYLPYEFLSYIVSLMPEKSNEIISREMRKLIGRF